MNALKQFRERAGLSQNQLAQRTRMHPAHLCLIERGAQTTQKTVKKLARALHATPAELFPGFDLLRKG